jgi:hypothetical protein
LLIADAGLFFALLGGTTTSTAQGGTDAYLHTSEILDTDVDLPSITMWEDSPSYGRQEFTGMCVTQIEIEWERSEFVLMRVTFMGDGAVAAGDDLSAIAVADTAEVYLKYSDVDVLIGGTYSEAGAVGSVAAGDSIKSQVRSGKVTIKNGGERVFHIGEGDVYASAIVQADWKNDDLVVVELETEPTQADGDLEADYLTAETLNVMEIKITGASMGGTEAAYFYTLDIIIPQTINEEGTFDDDNNVATLSQKYMAFKETANGWPLYQAQTTNKDVAYLG